MMDFIRGTVSGDITDVPGIGPAAAKKLASGDGDEKITNTYQLFGKVSIFYLLSSCSLYSVCFGVSYIWIIRNKLQLIKWRQLAFHNCLTCTCTI